MSLDEVLSIPCSCSSPPFPSGHSVNFASGTSGFLTMTGESLKVCWDMGIARRGAPSGVMGEGDGDTKRGGGDTAGEDSGLLAEVVVTPLGREKVGVCVLECEIGMCGDSTLKELPRSPCSTSVLGV